MSMEHVILGDTDQETIINVFSCKQRDAMKLFVADFFQKAHIDRVTETRVTLISSLPTILCNLTAFQLPHTALT